MAETLARLEGAFQGPVLGYLVTRLGSRTIMAAGGVISGLGFILLSFTHSYLYFLLVFVGLLSLASRGGYNTAAVPAINHWFRRKRGLAISVVSSGQGLGGVVITPVVGLMLVTMGWRPTAFISGIAILAVVVPLSFFIRRSPESMGLLPDGLVAETQEPLTRTEGRIRQSANPGGSRPATEDTPTRRPFGDTDLSAKDAMRTPSYWLVVLAVALHTSVRAGVYWHLAPLLIWGGASATTAALLVGFMSFNIMILAPFVGWMGDRGSKQRLCAAAMSVGSLSMVLLMVSSGHLWRLALFVVLLSTTQSITPLNWALMADFFGRSSYATLHGWLQMPNQFIGMSSPVWVGWVFDRTDSYFWALVPFAILFGLAAIVYWTLPRPKVPARVR